MACEHQENTRGIQARYQAHFRKKQIKGKRRK